MATRSLRKIIQHEAYQIVLLQLACVTMLAIVASFVRDVESGFAVWIGGLAYGLPNLAFVWRVFRYAGANQMERFMAAFFFGEMIKLVLSAILFLLIVKYLPVSLLSVLVGFIGAIGSFWIVCMWHFSKKASVKQHVAQL